MNRRQALGSAAALATSFALPAQAQAARRKPNIVLILADDLGYGDLGAFGARMIRTPNLDRMAREGAKLTTFYASANLCTPSRAGLLTGRYPIRTGLAHQVIQPNDTNGLPLSEITIPEALKPDYATALVGKWHLGHVAPFWPPTQHGFDLFHGLPYSHDMRPLNLYDATAGGGVELIPELDFHQLTHGFFQRGIRFIEDNRQKPFFLMLALTAPHVTLDPHPDFVGHSQAAAYGDVVEEVDANVGVLLQRLRALGLDRDTLVIVTSDNGPWFEGSAGGMRDRKGGASFDGGYRVPFLARQPGRIPAGITNAGLAMNIDILPTLCAWTGLPLPAAQLDGRDITPMLTRRNGPSPHDELVLFNNEQVAAIRTDRWKLATRAYYRGTDFNMDRYSYLLFDLQADPAETYDLSTRYPQIRADLDARLARARATFDPLATRPPPTPIPPLAPR
jgi:arylsulfatase A-like enzyme